MNLHINVIRGCFVLGYFQQRGWEDVKHAKPLCIYANRAPFSNLNMNLAEIKLFTSAPLRYQCVFFFFAHAHKLHSCWHIKHTFMPCSRVRAEINGCTLGHVDEKKIVDSQRFCCLIMSSSRDTANIAVISGSKACMQVEHTISV